MGKPMGESMRSVLLCERHLNTFVDLELAFEASIVSFRIIDNGAGQVCNEKEQSVHRQAVPRSNTLSLNASKCENAEGKSRKAMNQTKGRIAECVGDPD
ncbi:hypothetical protein H5410_002528 [Solanum commersonii]|uniref:Uncharacterized protein n=1 Tax=Solanum commersonii TaxID=4109 RepID=A0A9J6B2I6_SOLCO|nr:hypothetical protein H5410_002528 [Solanum commersonii]